MDIAKKARLFWGVGVKNATLEYTEQFLREFRSEVIEECAQITIGLSKGEAQIRFHSNTEREVSASHGRAFVLDKITNDIRSLKENT